MLGLIGVLTLALAGCATDATTTTGDSVRSSGFMSDYSMLRRGGEGEAISVYWNDEADFNVYSNMLINPATDTESYFVSEASVYRLLKAHDLITSPAFIVIKAADEFKDKVRWIRKQSGGLFSRQTRLTSSGRPTSPPLSRGQHLCLGSSTIWRFGLPEPIL